MKKMLADHVTIWIAGTPGNPKVQPNGGQILARVTNIHMENHAHNYYNARGVTVARSIPNVTYTLTIEAHQIDDDVIQLIHSSPYVKITFEPG